MQGIGDSTFNNTTSAGSGASILLPLLLQGLISGKSQMVQDPNSYVPNTQIPMSKLQYASTFDPAFRKGHPALAAMNAYYHPFQTVNSPAYRIGEEFARPTAAGIGGKLNNILDSGTGPSALAGAGIGALLSSLAMGSLNAASGNSLGRDMLPAAATGAAIGGLSGGYLGYRRNNPARPMSNPARQLGPSDMHGLEEQYRREGGFQVKAGSMFKGPDSSSFPSANGEQIILSALQAAPGLSFHEKGQLMSGVSKLSQFELNELVRLLGSAGFASIGALVAKFLMKRGLVGTVMGAVFGGVLGKTLINNIGPKTFTGQHSMGSFDFSGNRIL